MRESVCTDGRSQSPPQQSSSMGSAMLCSSSTETQVQAASQCARREHPANVCSNMLTWPSARRNTGKKHGQCFYPCKPAAAEQSSNSGLPHLQCPRQHGLFRFHRSGEIQQRFVWSELTNVLYVQWLNRYLIRTLNTFSVHSRFEISEK